MQVVIGDKPGVECDIVRGERYSSRCRYSRMESFHEITVTKNWINTVYAFNLEQWCDRLVIDMKFLGVADDCQVLLEITTVKQGLGTALETENVTVFGVNRPFAKVGKRLPMVHPMPAGVAADFMQDKGVPDKFTNALRLNPF